VEVISTFISGENQQSNMNLFLMDQRCTLKLPYEDITKLNAMLRTTFPLHACQARRVNRRPELSADAPLHKLPALCSAAADTAFHAFRFRK